MSMTAFLIVAALVLLSVTAWLVRPLLAPKALSAETESPALRVLREQRRELETDLAANRISAAEHADSMAELEQRTAAEMAALAAPGEARAARGWAAALGLGLPAAAIGLYLIIGQPAGLDPANTAPQQAFGAGEIEAMVSKLAAKVAANPDDLEGAQMLGRSYMVLERFDEAVKVFAALAQRRPQDAQVRADWADALGSVQGNRLSGEPARLIDEALTLDPDNVKALALAGSVAFEQEDYRRALRHWQRMASKVDPQSEIGRNADAMIAEAQQRLTGAAPVPAPSPAVAANGLQMAGRISVSASLHSQFSPDDALFIFARPAAGGPPIAALRMKAGDLPASFDFARAQLMGGDPGQGPFVIGARISKSGEAKAGVGDMEGYSVGVSPNTKDIIIEIDKIIK
ncbi:c-type cytochrome biogenesis protein CcmI [Uliginosibacterium sp. IMCC34675]|uniref:C-type cytochrome biogenesis protein CcmI n=2 Tax=Uliginosibacterium aquaticum TaxID=2731212 RepID=A0ABX2IB09_9RHOO|nr:c-type cytochrome biogenesis protein CcmI [Uliginosibacterium aquaticum]